MSSRSLMKRGRRGGSSGVFSRGREEEEKEEEEGRKEDVWRAFDPNVFEGFPKGS